MLYFAKFKDTGERETTRVEGVHFRVVINPDTGETEFDPPMPEGFVEITAEEQDLYAQNGGADYIRGEDGKPAKVPAYVPTKEELKACKLQRIDTWTATAITGGFQSAATGAVHTYDSDVNDQFNLHAMFSATLTAAFETAAPYYGVIPIRAIPQGETEKVILQHNKAQMEQLFKDLALHIGACKQKAWQLQQAVAAAETAEELANIEWPE